MAPKQRSALIVGAGIGGLATAIALRREGWKVTILEGAPQIGEVGAGIQIPPNASRIVLKWGLREKLEKVACKPINARIWRYDNCAPLSQSPFDAEDVFGVPYYHIHRADYFNILHAEAIAPTLSSPSPNSGPPAELIVNSIVTSVDCDNASVKTSDGRTYSADVLIGADGVKSIVKGVVTGEPDPAKPSGDQAYRFLIPVEKIKEYPELAFCLE
ncbi:hypothetical protein HDU93_002870 [Gonapodya sp. JEL0774]|nr:hypothetical protein HDU93_002870 [Gonapodya sp. JEL0774]